MPELDSAQVFITGIVILLIFPTYRAITRWILDRLLTWWEFFLLQIMTALTMLFLLQRGWNKPTLIVLVIYNLFWLLEPSLRNLSSGRNLRNLQQMEIAKYQHLVREHPDNPVYHTALGDLFRAQKRYDDAITCYRRAVGLLPEKFRRTEQSKLDEVVAIRNASRR